MVQDSYCLVYDAVSLSNEFCIPKQPSDFHLQGSRGLGVLDP